MNHSLGLAIESLVAVLMLLTIGYCALLNKRLKLLRNDEQSMRGTIAELVTATEIAERAIGGLKVTVRECDENLGNQLLNGAELAAKLKKQVAAGEEILHRLSQIALAARPHEAPPVTQAPPRADAKAVLAAAQAFSDRRRDHGRAA
ncbi:MAG: chemotaxis protein [Afipia sp.]|nr:chemotaxis protein [Afipia sp.]